MRRGLRAKYILALAQEESDPEELARTKVGSEKEILKIRPARYMNAHLNRHA